MGELWRSTSPLPPTSAANGLQCGCPGDERFEGLFGGLTRCECGEVFEVRGKGECHLGADVGNLQFAGDQAQVRRRFSTARTPPALP